MYKIPENQGQGGGQNYLYLRDILEVEFNAVWSLIGTYSISPICFFKYSYGTEKSLPFSKFYIQFQYEALVSHLEATLFLFLCNSKYSA